MIDVRGFGLEVDQPLPAGGSDMAPTPTELFVSSLASCIAFYAGRYLRRHNLSEDLAVHCDFKMSDRPPHRVTSVALEVSVAAELTEKERSVLLRVVDGCTVHNTLRWPPVVQVSVVEKPLSVQPQDEAA